MLSLSTAKDDSAFWGRLKVKIWAGAQRTSLAGAALPQELRVEALFTVRVVFDLELLAWRNALRQGEAQQG